jgi:Fur family zinc uptake transcriptional regulator
MATAQNTEARLDLAARICAGQGAKLTAQRRAVLRLILDAQGPLTAYQLLDRLKQEQDSAVPPTIYRALDFLLENRLIHKIERLSAFVSCIDAGHDHAHAAQFLICRRCGAVAELEDQGVARAIERAAAAQKFAPASAVVEIEGFCAACAGPTPPL